MAPPEKTIQPDKPYRVRWTTILSLLTVLVAAGTIALHLIGDIIHRQYLRHFAISSDLFPKPVDWILINGYYGLVDRFILFLVTVAGNLPWLVVTALAFGLYVFILLSPTGGAFGQAPAWLLRQPAWRRRLIRQTLLTAIFVSALPLALLVLTTFMIVLSALGETAGKSAAENNLAEFRKGCSASKVPCVELKSDGKLVATGFVLDNSTSHIAIFDAQLGRGRVLPLDKLEVLAERAPKLVEVSVPRP